MPRSGIPLNELLDIGRAAAVAARQPPKRKNYQVALQKEDCVEYPRWRLKGVPGKQGGAVEWNHKDWSNPIRRSLSGKKNKCESECGTH